MKLTLALSLALAAVLVVEAAAAAELPTRQTQQAAPEGKKCRIDGQEGVIPTGSDVCLRLSGSLSVQETFGNATTLRHSDAP